MPYKDPNVQREYARKWIAKRRADWFADKVCVVCNSVEQLELDHIDPSLKVHHAIWSWSWKRIEEETAKCQVLCHKHHKEKTLANNEYLVGEKHGSAKLTLEEVDKIRVLYAQKTFNQYQLANIYLVSQKQVSRIVRNERWK